jgi:hypothetical protein
MAQNSGDFTSKLCRVVVKFLFLKGNSDQKMYNDMSVTLGDKAPFVLHSQELGLLGLEQDI